MKKIILPAILVCSLFTAVYAAAAQKAVEFVHVGPNWAALNELRAPANSFDVRVSGHTDLDVGDRLRFKVTSSKAGRLWIIQVDPQDNVNVLAPGKHWPDNRIQAFETITVPPENSGISFQASEPRGKSILCFIVTTGDLDLSQALGSGKAIKKALTIVEDPPAWGFENIVVDVK